MGFVGEPLLAEEICAHLVNGVLVVGDGAIWESECIQGVGSCVGRHDGLDDTTPSSLLAEALGSSNACFAVFTKTLALLPMHG